MVGGGGGGGVGGGGAGGEFHSGGQLGERLGMSRAAINKHIQTLRDWGVDVFTVPGKGYS
ncbi:hypothetical protein C4651_21045, partial [Salmonella enterica subsp. enterica serovar Muenster]|uniref:HTH domain-containing protein n=1 Tax=Salmonella enterica TaxID=28901 RepID=UPI000D585E85